MQRKRRAKRRNNKKNKARRADLRVSPEAVEKHRFRQPLDWNHASNRISCIKKAGKALFFDAAHRAAELCALRRGNFIDKLRADLWVSPSFIRLFGGSIRQHCVQCVDQRLRIMQAIIPRRAFIDKAVLAQNKMQRFSIVIPIDLILNGIERIA